MDSERTSVMARFDVTSFELTELAAAGGTPEALLELGLLYCAGWDDVAIDLVSAHQWSNLAAIRGTADAKR
jgi:TPR repeat protein